MEKSKNLTITETRKKLFEIVEKVQMPGTSYVITERGNPKAVLLSFDEYESLIETLDILQEDPNLTQEINKAHKEFERGEYYFLEERNGEFTYKKFSSGVLKKFDKAAKKNTGKRSD